MVQFLAFGGFRKGEAANITWPDCDFDRGEILVRGDAETGTKNWSVRRVPMIPEMRQLLQWLRGEPAPQAPVGAVMRVRESPKSMGRAAKAIGLARITHHDLRHLLATRCIESGVDILKVSCWLVYKDGGALAMRAYGHLRDQHSTAIAAPVTFSTRTKANLVQFPKTEGTQSAPGASQKPFTVVQMQNQLRVDFHRINASGASNVVTQAEKELN